MNIRVTSNCPELPTIFADIEPEIISEPVAHALDSARLEDFRGQGLVGQVVLMRNLPMVVSVFSGMPVEGYSPKMKDIADVGPPDLIMIAGMWGSGSGNLEEILVEFDRPVQVNSLRLHDEQDGKVGGDYFVSIFRMAVVVRPENPGGYREGEVLRVEWDVVNDLSRSSIGTNRLPIRRFEH